jgi:hypothetical protein
MILAHFNKPDINHDLCDFAELTNIRMSDMETIISYINRINILIEWMTTATYKFKPAWMIHFILHGLPPSFLGVVTIIQTQADILLEFTHSTLLQHKSSLIHGAEASDSS